MRKKSFRRGDMSDIKKRVAIEKDLLKPFGVNNVERQIMVSNPIEEDRIRSPLLLNLPRNLPRRNWS